MNEPTRIRIDHLDEIQRIRGIFEAADFTQAGIEKLLGCPTPIAPIALRIPPEALTLSGDSPLETLIRLFLLKRSADIDTVRRLIAPMDLETWVRGGLLRVEEHRVAAAVRVLPYANQYIACDQQPSAGTDKSDDFVMGIGLSTMMLVESTIRSNVKSMLDLGTGTGVQALLAAQHCQKVCGADVNPRALEFARFNASLNGVSHAEFLQGDLFKPVASRRFDLIVCNPPYVISPTCRAYYRDNPEAGDRFCERIVKQAPSHLNEEGVFQMVFDWAHLKGQPWQARLAEWCENSSCDCWIMRQKYP